MSLKISSTMHEPATGKAPAPKKPPFIGSPLLAAIKRIAKKTGEGIRSLIRISTPSKKAVEVPIVGPRKPISAKNSASVKKTPVNEEKQSKAASSERQPGAVAWLPKLLWGVSALMVVLVIYLGLNFLGVFTTQVSASTQIQTTPQGAVLPTYASTPIIALERVTDPKTTLSDRGDDYIQRYIVQPLEGVYSIATKFNIKPETVLWSNESELRSDPNTIPVNSILYIPPVDGVYYPWKEGDTLEKVAAKFEVTPNDILTWPSNHLDLTNPVIVPGQYVMIPNGKGSAIEWVVPIPYSAHSGANRSIADQCNVTGYYPWSGGFIWPTSSHLISGNDFWAGHLGLDIGAYLGDSVWASSAGVVIWAGNMSGGYGNVVVIEHDNGANIWVTLYAHLSAIAVRCGDVVSQGQPIGSAGSSGNSTGPHLHFEIRENGAFINPHYVLGN